MAIATIKRLCEFGIYFAEQPVAPEQSAQLAEVRRAVPVPVIADESVFTLKDVRMLAVTLQLKPLVVGEFDHHCLLSSVRHTEATLR